jgi:hypothetical protein
MRLKPEDNDYAEFVNELSDDKFIELLNAVEARKAEVLLRQEARAWLFQNKMPDEVIKLIRQQRTIPAMKALHTSSVGLKLRRAIIDCWREKNGLMSI